MKTTPTHALADRWDDLSDLHDTWADRDYAKGVIIAASSHRGMRDALRQCAEELRHALRPPDCGVGTGSY